MRTTIEISNEHRAQLMELAARRGEKGFSGLVAEALSQYLMGLNDRVQLRERALATRGSLSADDADAIREVVKGIRESWR